LEGGCCCYKLIVKSLERFRKKIGKVQKKYGKVQKKFWKKIWKGNLKGSGKKVVEGSENRRSLKGFREIKEFFCAKQLLE